MKLRIALGPTVFAAAALATTWGALAQDAGTGALPPPSPNFTIPDLDQYVRGDAATASREVHRACDAEMRTLCPGKAGAAADRCLVYHRLNFSKACRRAITGFERAAAPLGEGDALADFHPYSRVPAPSRAPGRGWRPIPTPPEPAATGA
jgi:hypothetical protein